MTIEPTSGRTFYREPGPAAAVAAHDRDLGAGEHDRRRVERADGRDERERRRGLPRRRVRDPRAAEAARDPALPRRRAPGLVQAGLDRPDPRAVGRGQGELPDTRQVRRGDRPRHDVADEDRCDGTLVTVTRASSRCGTSGSGARCSCAPGRATSRAPDAPGSRRRPACRRPRWASTRRRPSRTATRSARPRRPEPAASRRRRRRRRPRPRRPVHGGRRTSTDEALRVLDDVRDRLGDDVVGGGLDRLGQPLVEQGQLDRQGRPRREPLERGVEAAVGQHRRVDPARELAQLLERVGELLAAPRRGSPPRPPGRRDLRLARASARGRARRAAAARRRGGSARAAAAPRRRPRRSARATRAAPPPAACAR